jgi:hypothetical protein
MALGTRTSESGSQYHGYRFLTANYHHGQGQEPKAMPIPSSLADFAVALPVRINPDHHRHESGILNSYIWEKARVFSL